MLRRVALVRIDVSEERSASIIRVTRIGKLGTTLAVTSNRRTRFLQETHFVTSRKTAFFIVTAVKASNLTQICNVNRNTYNSQLSYYYQCLCQSSSAQLEAFRLLLSFTLSGTITSQPPLTLNIYFTLMDRYTRCSIQSHFSTGAGETDTYIEDVSVQ
jgi:hypothetical protein